MIRYFLCKAHHSFLMLGNTGQDLSTAFGVVLYSKIMNQENNAKNIETLQKELHFTEYKELKQEGRRYSTSTENVHAG